MKRFVIWLCSLFNLISIPRDEYNDLAHNFATSTVALQNAKMECERLHAIIVACDGYNMNALHEENERLKADVKKAEDYYQQIQTEMHNVLKESPQFAFHRSQCFPGSAVMQLVSSPKNSGVSINGRSVFDDDTTAKIQHASSISDKYKIALDYVNKTGMINRVASQLINNGALTFTLAYNPDCTVLEFYYTITADTPENPFVLDTEYTKR